MHWIWSPNWSKTGKTQVGLKCIFDETWVSLNLWVIQKRKEQIIIVHFLFQRKAEGAANESKSLVQISQNVMFLYTGYRGSSLPRSGIFDLTLSDHFCLSSALPWLNLLANTNSWYCCCCKGLCPDVFMNKHFLKYPSLIKMFARMK